MRLGRRELASLAAAWCVIRALPAWAQDKDVPSPGEPQKKTAVDLALAWLARHQAGDGTWRGDTFSGRCTGDPCDGEVPGDAAQGGHVRLTGRVLQLFLAAGETHQSGTYKLPVKDGLKALYIRQAKDGVVGVRGAGPWVENHLAAAGALVETYGMTQSKIFAGCSQLAVDASVAMFDASRALSAPQPGVVVDAASVTELVLVLRSARIAGLKVPPAAFDAVAAWFAERTDAKTGAWRPEDPKRKPDAADEDRAACAALARVWCPDPPAPKADPATPKLAEQLAAKPAAWVPGAMDFAAWERRTQIHVQAQGEASLAWNRALVTLLVDKQRIGGCAEGSWDPVDVGARSRVEATALCALACTWPYRYGARGAKPAAPKPTPK